MLAAFLGSWTKQRCIVLVFSLRKQEPKGEDSCAREKVCVCVCETDRERESACACGIKTEKERIILRHREIWATWFLYVGVNSNLFGIWHVQLDQT